MNIQEYFRSILNEQGYDAWEEAIEKAWRLYNLDEEYVDFELWATYEGIDLCLKDERGYLYLTLWAWDMIDE